MPVPKRTQIREAIKTILMGQTACGDNVYSNRTSAYWKSELPCISIFMAEEPLSPRDMSQKTYIRKPDISIEIRAEANENLDEILDEVNDKIEELILANSNLNGTVQGLVFTNIDFETANDGTTNIGILTLSIQVQYTK